MSTECTQTDDGEKWLMADEQDEFFDEVDEIVYLVFNKNEYPDLFKAGHKQLDSCYIELRERDLPKDAIFLRYRTLDELKGGQKVYQSPIVNREYKTDNYYEEDEES